MKASESLSLHIILKVGGGGDTSNIYLQPPLTAKSTVSLEFVVDVLSTGEFLNSAQKGCQETESKKCRILEQGVRNRIYTSDQTGRRGGTGDWSGIECFRKNHCAIVVFRLQEHKSR
jgi:hypothetical protein